MRVRSRSIERGIGCIHVDRSDPLIVSCAGMRAGRQQAGCGHPRPVADDSPTTNAPSVKGPQPKDRSPPFACGRPTTHRSIRDGLQPASTDNRSNSTASLLGPGWPSIDRTRSEAEAESDHARVGAEARSSHHTSTGDRPPMAVCVLADPNPHLDRGRARRILPMPNEGGVGRRASDSMESIQSAAQSPTAFQSVKNVPTSTRPPDPQLNVP